VTYFGTVARLHHTGGECEVRPPLGAPSVNFPESSPLSTPCTLTCEAVDRQAIRYFFNGLPEERSESIRNHLAMCLRCRSKLEVFARVWFRDGQRRKAKLN
jgi:hypothetical protein